ncbi:adenylosuccinate lyase [Tanacetum coccineum]
MKTRRDLGGGTIDVSILEISNDVYEVLIEAKQKPIAIQMLQNAHCILKSIRTMSQKNMQSESLNITHATNCNSLIGLDDNRKGFLRDEWLTVVIPDFECSGKRLKRRTKSSVTCCELLVSRLSLAYELMLKEVVNSVILPMLDDLMGAICTMAKANAHVPILSRIHGQPASPTTLGKVIVMFADRLSRERQDILEVEILGSSYGLRTRCKVSFNEAGYHLRRMWYKFGLGEMQMNDKGILFAKFSDERGMEECFGHEEKNCHEKVKVVPDEVKSKQVRNDRNKHNQGKVEYKKKIDAEKEKVNLVKQGNESQESNNNVENKVKLQSYTWAYPLQL